MVPISDKKRALPREWASLAQPARCGLSLRKGHASAHGIEDGVVGVEVVGADIGIPDGLGGVKGRQVRPVRAGERDGEAAAVKLFAGGFEAGGDGHGLEFGVLPPGEAVLLRLVADADPFDAGVSLGFGEVLNEFAEAEGPFIEGERTAAEDADGVLGELGVGVPGNVSPHLGEEDVDAAKLGPVEDAIEDLHLGVVPGEVALVGLVDALLELDAAPVHAEPVGVMEEIVPMSVVAGIGVAAPLAA